jgi:hypothetical protein
MTTIGRNEPCPCGSGKKYKYCCAAKARRTPLGTKVVGSLIALALVTGAAIALLTLSDFIR